MIKFIELLNEAILISDPQGTWDYFGYLDEEILSMMEEGLESVTRVALTFFDNNLAIYSMKEPYYDNLVRGVSEIYDGFVSSQENEEAPVNNHSSESELQRIARA